MECWSPCSYPAMWRWAAQRQQLSRLTASHSEHTKSFMSRRGGPLIAWLACKRTPSVAHQSRRADAASACTAGMHLSGLGWLALLTWQQWSGNLGCPSALMQKVAMFVCVCSFLEDQLLQCCCGSMSRQPCLAMGLQQHQQVALPGD